MFLMSAEYCANEIVGIRSLNVSSPLCLCGVRADAVAAAIKKFAGESFIITKAPPKQNERYHTLQGELTYQNKDFYLFYALQWGYMRKVLESGRVAAGLDAVRLITRFCDKKSVEMLFGLLDKYTFAGAPPIVELTVFPPEVPKIGRFPEMNTLIWEVRHY